MMNVFEKLAIRLVSSVQNQEGFSCKIPPYVHVQSFLEFGKTQFLDRAAAVSPHQKRCQSNPLNYKMGLEPKFKDYQIWCFDWGIAVALGQNNSTFFP